MVQVKDLTKNKTEDLWREVKWDDSEFFEKHLRQEKLRMTERLLESTMVEELLESLRAGHYRRTEPRR